MCALCGVLGGSEHWADAHATITAVPVLQHDFRIGGVIAVVRAVNIAGQLGRYPGSLKQVPTHIEAWPAEDRRSRLVVVPRGLDAPVERSMAALGVMGPSARLAWPG